jgi:hypothetical protein
METISRISSMLETGMRSYVSNPKRISGDLIYRTSQPAARDLTLEVAQSASANKGSRNRSTLGNTSFSQLKKLLDSKHDREVLDAMRKVISVWGTKHPALSINGMLAEADVIYLSLYSLCIARNHASHSSPPSSKMLPARISKSKS